MRHFSNGLDGDWDRVTGAAPCPVCGGDADCRTHSDEAFVCCVQRPSDWRLNNGGWLHRLASNRLEVSGGLEVSSVAVLAGAQLGRMGVGSSGARP
jgi:hypothetical protein